MPCRWHEKQIVVLEVVIIDEPYTPERVRSQDKPALNRVKKVVCTLHRLPLLLLSRWVTNGHSSRENEENLKQRGGLRLRCQRGKVVDVRTGR